MLDDIEFVRIRPKPVGFTFFIERRGMDKRELVTILRLVKSCLGVGKGRGDEIAQQLAFDRISGSR